MGSKKDDMKGELGISKAYKCTRMYAAKIHVNFLRVKMRYVDWVVERVLLHYMTLCVLDLFWMPAGAFFLTSLSRSLPPPWCVCCVYLYIYNIALNISKHTNACTPPTHLHVRTQITRCS